LRDGAADESSGRQREDSNIDRQIPVRDGRRVDREKFCHFSRVNIILPYVNRRGRFFGQQFLLSSLSISTHACPTSYLQHKCIGADEPTAYISISKVVKCTKEKLHNSMLRVNVGTYGAIIQQAFFFCLPYG